MAADSPSSTPPRTFAARRDRDGLQTGQAKGLNREDPDDVVSDRKVGCEPQREDTAWGAVPCALSYVLYACFFYCVGPIRHSFRPRADSGLGIVRLRFLDKAVREGEDSGFQLVPACKCRVDGE